MTINNLLKGIIITVWSLMAIGSIFSLLGGVPLSEHRGDFILMVIVTVVLYQLIDDKKPPIINRVFKKFTKK